MDTLLLDLRYGLRSLGRNRAFTAAALLCLAIGIGVNTGIYTIVNAILLRPLPVAHADRLASIFWTDYTRDIDDWGVAFGDLEDFWATGLFEQLEAVHLRDVSITGSEATQQVNAASVTPGLFGLIGARPALGRDFTVADAAVPGQEQSVILSHGLWQRQFGGTADIVGRGIPLNGRTLTVIGVMPEGFRFPEQQDLWLPLRAADPAARTGRVLWPIGLLRPGVSVAAAAPRVADVGARIAAADPTLARGLGATLMSYRDAIVDPPARRALLLMLGAVGFLLLIASANVANLMLARAADRRRELALRTALGAGRARIVRQLLTEALAIALVAALLGLLIGRWWIDASTRLIPDLLAYWIRFDLDASVLLYTLGLALGTVLLFGLVPALQSSRTDLQSDLKHSARTGSARSGSRLRATLVVAEVALSLMLLVGAALMVQSFLRIQRADPGFATADLLTLRGLLVGDEYDARAARARTWHQAAEQLRGLPGVRGAAVTSAIPADDGGPTVRVAAEGGPETAANGLLAMLFGSSAGYFETLDVPLIAGRAFRAEEVQDTAASVAIVGHALAQRLWPGADAVGRTLRLEDGTALSVIGVAPDLQYDEFGEDVVGTRYQLHVPLARTAWRELAFVLRTQGDAAALLPGVRRALAGVAPRLATFEEMTFEQRRHYTQWERRLLGNSFATFGGIALLLALAGIYGVVSYSISRRRHEIGVRLALGASPRRTVALIVWQTARLALLGVAIGLAGALLVTRALEGLLFGITASDPATLLALPLLLAAAALLAAWLPARRAARVDPLITLRAE